MGLSPAERNANRVPDNVWDPGPDIRRPDSHEFEGLYKEYRARVFALCLCMTANRDEAEDLTQDTFVRLFSKLDTFRGESTFYTWLHRVAVNVVLLRFQKASWRRETSLDELTEAGGDTLEFGSFDAELTETIDRVDLERAIEQLPPGSKAVLLMHDVEGYQHNEISRQMGCSCGTSKSQLHKARSRVRELLQPAWGIPSSLEGTSKPVVSYSAVPQA